LAGIIAVAAYGPTWWGQYLYVSGVRDLQTQCLRYIAPPDKIVYDTDPLDRNELLSRTNYHPFNDWSVFTTPVEWHAFRGSYACPDGTAFLHGRRAVLGPQRLVSVDIIPAAADVIWLRWGVSDRVPRFSMAGIEQARKTSGETTIRLDAHGRPLRLYAGQIDPQDSSAFTIRGSFGTEPFQIDGRLLHTGLVDLRPHPVGTNGASVPGISFHAAGPIHTGLDPAANLPACNLTTTHLK
jgi:hypothetical protein